MERFVLASNLLSIRFELPISKSIFEALKKHSQTVEQLLLLEERFDLLATNFLEFETLIVARLLHFEHLGYVDGRHQMLVRRDANRVLMNVVTSARAYIDQLPQVLNVVFGDNSTEKNHALRHLSVAYDDAERPGYRIFEALRNHTVHSGFPIHTTSYATRMIGDRSMGLSSKSFQVSTVPEKLANNGRFRPAILEELISMGEQVDLRPLLCQYLAGISGAHYYVRQESKAVLDVAFDNLRGHHNEYVKVCPDTSSAKGVHAVYINNGRWSDKIPLGTGNNSYLEYLRTLNVYLDRADKEMLIGNIPRK